jgi:F-type H+-transporting ATPase subunit delta
MKSSKQSRRDAKNLFRASLVNGRLNEDRIRTAVSRLVESKPRGYLAILTQLQRLVKLEKARRTARIESAVPLTGDLEQQVRANLQRVYGDGLEIGFHQNPQLLGGLRIQVGSDVYDGSIATRLKKMEESF